METENKQGIFEFHFESENTIEIEFCFKYILLIYEAKQ